MNRKSPVGCLSNGAFFLLAFLSSTAPRAENVSPFYTHDQNPLVAIYGLPTPVSGKIAAENKPQLHVSLNIMNTINDETTATESLLVDIETYRLNIFYDYAVSENWMLRLQLPFIQHSGGFLDSWIDSYHDLFGLPEGPRPSHPRDRIEIAYSFNGIQQLDIRSRQSGIGDISLQAAYQGIATREFHLSYWASLKLPTGDSEKLTGSGSTDLTLWFAANKKLAEKTWLIGNLGIVFMSESEVLEELHEDNAFFGTLGMQFHPWQDVQLKFQFDAHSAFYDSNTDFLGDVIQVTFGGTVLFKNNSSLDIAVTEDIQTEASPDVNFNITWRSYFN